MTITIDRKAGFKHIQISGLPSQPSDSRTLGVGPVIFIRTTLSPHFAAQLTGEPLGPNGGLENPDYCDRW